MSQLDRKCLSNTGKVEKPAWLFGSFIRLTKKKNGSGTNHCLPKTNKQTKVHQDWHEHTGTGRCWLVCLMIVPRMHLRTRAPRHWRTCPRLGPVTGSPPAGTEAPWRWSNPPRSPAGTQKWASPQALSSSRSALGHAGIQGTPLGMAFGSHAPPGPTPLCSPYLGEQRRPF